MTDAPITVYRVESERWQASCLAEASAAREAQRLFPLPPPGLSHVKTMEAYEAQAAFIRERRQAWDATHKLADDVTPLLAYRIGDATHREACEP